MRVFFANVDKKDLNSFNDNIKYVLITENQNEIKKYLSLKIKPIIILYDGSYVVDLENNNVIIDKSIDERSYSKIINYSNSHNVNYKIYEKQNKVYEIKITTNNYHRRLIIPYMFRDLIPNIKSLTRGKSIYITSKEASLINAIDEVLNYLNITNNYIDLENICTNVSIEGYYNDKLNWKGFEFYENKTEDRYSS